MKYYKLTITGGGYDSIHNGPKAFELGKIYPEDCTLGNTCNVGTYAKYSSFWIKVPEIDYFVQEGKMPEYFAIKRVEGDPLWQKYIDYLNDTYNTNWGGHYFNFYGYDNSQCFGGTDGKFSLEDFKNNPVELTLEQWDKIINKTMEEEFELPEKWCVRIDKQEVVDYCNVHGLYPPYKIIEDGTTYAHFPGWNDCTTCNGIKSGYTEITYSQFIKYVLNKEGMEENKEIIGWKLKEDCKQYKKAACEITNNSGLFAWTEKFDVGYDFRPSSPVEGILEQAGVLELWFEPVHKEKTLKFGGYDVTFEKVTSGVRISCNGETGTCGQIEAIYNYFKPNSTYFKFGSQEVRKITYGQNGSWNLEDEPDSPTEIKIGCTTGTWEEFVAIYEKAKSML